MLNDSDYLRHPNYKKTYKVHLDPTWDIAIDEWAHTISVESKTIANLLFSLDKSIDFIRTLEASLDEEIQYII